MNLGLLFVLCLTVLAALAIRRSLKSARITGQGEFASLEHFNVSALVLLLSSTERTYLQARLPWWTFYKLHFQRTRAALGYLYELELAISRFHILVIGDDAPLEIRYLATEAVNTQWLILQLKLLAVASLILPTLDLSAEKIIDFRNRALEALKSPALEAGNGSPRPA